MFHCLDGGSCRVEIMILLSFKNPPDGRHHGVLPALPIRLESLAYHPTNICTLDQ